MTDDRILLEGMVFFGRHGVLAIERELGQRFVVDLEMRMYLRWRSIYRRDQSVRVSKLQLVKS